MIKKVSILIEVGKADEVRASLQGIAGIEVVPVTAYGGVVLAVAEEIADLTALDLIIKKIRSIVGVKKLLPV